MVCLIYSTVESGLISNLKPIQGPFHYERSASFTTIIQHAQHGNLDVDFLHQLLRLRFKCADFKLDCASANGDVESDR